MVFFQGLPGLPASPGLPRRSPRKPMETAEAGALADANHVKLLKASYQMMSAPEVYQI